MTITEVDDPHRTARADVARLALQLRAAKRAADEAIAEQASAGDAGPAQEALVRTLHERVERRRREQAEELAEARAAAVTLVESARADAAALVVAASAGAAEVLFGAVPPTPAPAPSLHPPFVAYPGAAPLGGWAAPGQPIPVPTQVVPVPPGSSADLRPDDRRGWSGFWHDVAYADVVLPLVAVLLVLAVLLAWVA